MEGAGEAVLEPPLLWGSSAHRSLNPTLPLVWLLVLRADPGDAPASPRGSVGIESSALAVVDVLEQQGSECFQLCRRAGEGSAPRAVELRGSQVAQLRFQLGPLARAQLRAGRGATGRCPSWAGARQALGTPWARAAGRDMTGPCCQTIPI